MQISANETLRALSRPRPRREPNGGKVKNVEELARKHGVDVKEARAAAERAMMQEEDPLRERRIRELAARVAEGTYQVDGEQVVEMAERRALADRVR
jgi:anti-sigma28 factor (negative regulator of flagellin synthesis)